MSIERRIVTVLFADLVDFTSLSERLDAEDVATIQDAYFEVVRDTLGRYGGSLEKFIGDAVMAAFGLGQARDDDAERAVRAGLALINGIDSLGPRLGLDVDDLRIRVGINSGETIVGAAVPTEGQGTELGRVTGDTVNVAARLQAAADPGRVLVGPETALAVEGSIELEPARSIALKGKSDPVPVRAVIRVRPEPSRALAMAGMVAPTMGRTEELDRLMTAGSAVRAGVTRLVLILAPPGVGKSRLLAEFSTRIAEPTAVRGPWNVWRTRSRQELGAPYTLIRDVMTTAMVGAGLGSADRRRALEGLVEAAGASPARAVVIADAVEKLLSPALPAADHADEIGDRDELFSAWSTALRVLAGSRPTCWLAEDLHRATEDEVAFIERLGADPGWNGLLVVGTARPSMGARAGDTWDRMDLAPLPSVDARGLVHALVGDALPAELAARIVERADGNPLFIEELLRTWVSLGTLDRAGPDGTWRLMAPATEVSLPTTIQAIYASQLDDLPGDARTTARRAAVAGRRFPIAILPELGSTDAAGTVDELARRAVVSGPAEDRVLGDTFSYRHALVRDAGYASLARAERADLHLRVARWLEAAAGEAVDSFAASIGGHYADALASTSRIAAAVGSGLDRDAVADRAASWLERAGDRAIELAAHDSARTALRRAIELTRSEDSDTLGRRLTRLGDSLAGSGNLDEAIDAYARATICFETGLDAGTALEAGAGPEARGPTSADTAARRRNLSRAARALAAAHFEQTRFSEALAVADRAGKLVGTEDDVARLPLDLIAIEARNALVNNARSLLPEATALRARGTAIGDPDLVLAAMHTDVRLRSEAGEDDVEEWRALADGYAARGRWSAATKAMLNAAARTSDAAAFEALAVRTDALAEARGQTESRAWLAQTRALRAFATGDWDQATDRALFALGLGEADSYHRVVVRTWFVLSPIAVARGDRGILERAAAWFEVRDREQTFPDSPYGRLMHAAIDIDLASAGLRPRTPPDLARLERAFGLAYDSADWLSAIERVVRAMLDDGRIEDARTALAAVPERPAAEREPLTGMSAALTRAWVAEAAGDRAAAASAARAALANDAEAAPWWAYRLLGVLERVGSATAEDLDRARDIETRLRLARGASS